MIKMLRYISVAMLMLAFVCSCTDEVFVDDRGTQVEEGLPIKVNFDFKVEKTAVQARAAQNTNTEYKVQNLYVFAFNGDQTLDAKKFYSLDDLSNTSEKQDDGTGQTKGTIPDFDMTTGNGKTFYAVANVGYSGLFMSAFDNIESLEDLKAVTSTLPTSTSLDRTFFIMSGQLADNGQTEFNIGTDVTTLNGTFLLKRTDARITFKVRSEAGNPRWTNFSFEPKNYRVVNIPQSTYVLLNESDATGNYGRMTQYLSFDNPNVKDGNDTYGIFDFYIQENRQTPKQMITNDALTDENAGATLFAMREEWTNKDDNGEKIFDYAPEHGTYVEINGLLSYQDETKDPVEFVSADVTYTIHLGNTGTAAEANSNANVYETLRNTHYTYNVKVKGVDNIIVEVEADNEKQPGAEGDVVIAGGEVLELDSHFDRYKFYLRKSDLRETSPDGMLTWAISTPFENAMRIKGEKELPHDYKWITFAINKEYGVDHEHYVKYPGDFAYDGHDGSTPSEQGTYVDPAWNGFNSNRSDGKVVLRDVEQLLNFLTAEAQKNSSDLFETYTEGGQTYSDVVVITAFVDEFLYVADPINPNGSTPTNPTAEGLLLWKKVVNGRDRMLHICRGAGQESTDGNSSVIRSVLSFKQHPIHTIYDVSQSDEDLKTAWGTEMIMETGKLAASFNHPHADIEPYDNTADNGRENQLNFVRDVQKEWTDIISTEERYGLNSSGGPNSINYNTIWHACMLRNRDINGDNKIDEREVRWYLAAIDQLSDLWIGDASINESARTYPSDANNARYHIASSTYWEQDNVPSSQNPTVLWAEEGSSIGDYNYSLGHGNPTGENYAYRCVRNLGIDLNASVADNVPQDYIRWNADTKTVDLSLLGYASKRTASDGGSTLPEHHERNTNNRPYAKFQVADEVYSRYQERRQEDHYPWEWSWEDVDYSWVDFNEHLYPVRGRASDPCPDGYRVPNQREMAIMLTIPDIKNEFDAVKERRYIVPTAFSMNGTGNYSAGNRYGFLYNSSDHTYILETGETNKGGTRCIRDVTE